MCLGFTFLMWILNVCDSNECDIFFDHSIPLQSRLVDGLLTDRKSVHPD